VLRLASDRAQPAAEEGVPALEGVVAARTTGLVQATEHGGSAHQAAFEAFDPHRFEAGPRQHPFGKSQRVQVKGELRNFLSRAKNR
jgi:hypothetical protein